MNEKLNTEQLLLLNNLMYMGDKTGMDFVSYMSNEGSTIGSFVEAVSQKGVTIQGDAYTSTSDWRAIVAMVDQDSGLKDLRMVGSYGDDLGGGAAAFVAPGSNEAIVAFRGTGSGEWPDNFEGGGAVSTQQQERALSWYQECTGDGGALSGYDVTVTGHSKGGNKAKFITVMDDSVSRCVSFNGQGFSDEFFDADGMSDKIAANQGKIENHNVDGDYVNILLNDIGKTTFYEGQNTDGNLVKNHPASALLDFGKNGMANTGPQSASMQALDKFLNSYLRSMDSADKQGALEMFGKVADLALRGDGATPEDIAKLLLDPSNMEKSSGLLAFIMEYERQVGITEDLRQAMEQLGIEGLLEKAQAISDFLHNDFQYSLFSTFGWALDDLPDWVVNILAKKFGIPLDLFERMGLREQFLRLLSLAAQKCGKIKIDKNSGADRKVRPRISDRRPRPHFPLPSGIFNGLFKLLSKDFLFKVVPSELRQAATALERAAEDYIAASGVAQDAAYDLTSKWEGDAREIFVTEQEHAFGWYFKMGDLCWSYAKFLRQAADEYEEADRQARRAIE